MDLSFRGVLTDLLQCCGTDLVEDIADSLVDVAAKYNLFPHAFQRPGGGGGGGGRGGKKAAPARFAYAAPSFAAPARATGHMLQIFVRKV